jgi:hypothetical protein
MPKTSATTKVFSTPFVRLLMPRLASATTPTPNRVPGVVRSAAESLDVLARQPRPCRRKGDRL